MSPKLAVIQFPGSNCEYETARFARDAGFDVSILRWNTPASAFHHHDVYVIPGGFSYQDRVRAGAISAKLPVMDWIVQAAEDGKPVLGICNGCQILAETGLIPGFKDSTHLEVALAPNQKHGQPLGFICDWVYVRIQNPEANVFTRAFSPHEVLPIPINHGEGRFVFSDRGAEALQSGMSIRYCTDEGQLSEDYPITPNGSQFGVAGMGCSMGNVLAIMPHPERSSRIRQVPTWIRSQWVTQKRVAFRENTEGPGPWFRMFESVHRSVAK